MVARGGATYGSSGPSHTCTPAPELPSVTLKLPTSGSQGGTSPRQGLCPALSVHRSPWGPLPSVAVAVGPSASRAQGPPLLPLLSMARVEAGTRGLLEAPVRGGTTALPRGHGPSGRTRLHLPSRRGLARPALLSLRCRRRSGPPLPTCAASPQVMSVSVCRRRLSWPVTVSLSLPSQFRCVPFPG